MPVIISMPIFLVWKGWTQTLMLSLVTQVFIRPLAMPRRAMFRILGSTLEMSGLTTKYASASPPLEGGRTKRLTSLSMRMSTKRLITSSSRGISASGFDHGIPSRTEITVVFTPRG
uniref:Uncharacterized protein n=1 Tax=Opuntia streptacantha TaxID=393608 RepID=A0A7C8ZKZ6_OPUST